MSDNTYTATVTLVVEQKQLDGLGAKFNDNWTYGETALDPIISGVSTLGADEYKIEYAKTATDSWSTTKPSTAGDYTIRLSIIGANYKPATYSSIFKILPTEKVVRIVANSSSHVYDGNAYTDGGYKVYFDGTEVTDGKLLYDDTINATITGSVTDVVDNSANNNIIGNVVITNKDSYKNIELVNGTISITPIGTPIAVRPKSDTKTYDGTALTNDQYTYTDGILIAGDTLTATITGSQTYVGSSENDVSNVKVMRGNKDITDNYAGWYFDKGTLTVTVAEQSVSIGNLNVRVGGTITNAQLLDEVSGAIGTISFEKVSGVGTYDASNGFTAGTITGTANMKVNVTAKDVNADGTNEYNSASKTFTISVVEKEEVTISGLTDNQTFTYDGNTKTPTGTITVSDNKVPASELEVLYEGTGSTTYSSATAPTNAGTYKVSDSNINYVGTKTYTFTIKKAQLEKVSLVQNTFVYTGEEISTSPVNWNDAQEITASKTDVLEGTTVTITFTPDTGYMIDKVSVNGTEKTVTGNELELTVNENKTVDVIYKKIPFTITVESVEGATVDPNGTVTVNYGDNKDFTITANTGYKLVKVLVNDEEKTLDGNTLKLTNITANMNIKVVVEKIVYEVIEGAEQTYTITEDTEARFRIDADYSLFNDKVYVNDELVDSENYTSKEGSTIITFKQSYVDTLAVGEHTLRVAFVDGGEATTTFTIAEKEEEINDDNNNDNNDNNNNNNISSETEKEDKVDNSSNPKTGDNIMLYVAIAGISILGLGVTVIVAKKRKMN